MGTNENISVVQEALLFWHSGTWDRLIQNRSIVISRTGKLNQIKDVIKMKHTNSNGKVNHCESNGTLYSYVVPNSFWKLGYGSCVITIEICFYQRNIFMRIIWNILQSDHIYIGCRLYCLIMKHLFSDQER